MPKEHRESNNREDSRAKPALLSREGLVGLGFARAGGNEHLPGSGNIKQESPGIQSFIFF